MSRVKQPDSNSPAQIANRLNNIRNWYTQNIYSPIFDFDHASQIGNDRKVNLVSLWMGGQSQSIIVPIRLENAFDQLEITDDWTIDLDTTTIDTTTFTGGHVDGVGLAANKDYLIWAFYDETEAPANRFKGFGLTIKPNQFTSARSGGGFGASATFTVPAGNGWRFNVGARIIARAGSGVGANYNQGVITSVTSTTVVATMDADYGVANESNAALSASVYDIIQTNNFAPRMLNEDSLYPGSGIEYQYAYIGNIQTDASSDIINTRKRGDIYSFLSALTVLDNSITGTTVYTVSLARWLPFDVKLTWMRSYIARTVGAGTGGRIHTGTGVIDYMISSSTDNNNQFYRDSGLVGLNVIDHAIESTIVVPGSTTMRGLLDLVGYFENNF